MGHLTCGAYALPIYFLGSEIAFRRPPAEPIRNQHELIYKITGIDFVKSLLWDLDRDRECTWLIFQTFTSTVFLLSTAHNTVA